MEKEIIRLCGLYGQTTRWGVYSTKGIAPTITASMGLGGGHIPMIVNKTQNKERIIVAQRGRMMGERLKQRLEPQFKPITNTITTVTKDNLVLEIEDTNKTSN